MRRNLIGNKLYLLFHPSLLALYAFLIILLFTPDYFEKYTAKITESRYTGEHYKTYYHDLNGDGKSENISTGYTNNEGIFIQHKDLDNKIYNQWMPRGKWLIHYKPFFDDYDNNGFAEIYCLTIDGDSIFLHINELMLEGGLIVKNRFVCKAGTYENGKTDIVDWGGKLIDINGDHQGEFIFHINGGFSKFPRNTFSYYIAYDSLIMSPPSASGYNNYRDYMDLDGDGIDEIVGSMNSPENINYSMPFTDSSSWLMVMNPVKMDFLFAPIRFNIGIGSSVNPKFYSINNKKYIASSIFCNSAKMAIDYLQLKLFDENGNLQGEKKVSKSLATRIFFINPKIENNKYFYLIDNNAKIYKTDSSLDLTHHYDPGFENIHTGNNKYDLMDADGDGQNEILISGNTKKGESLLLIYRQNLKDAISIMLPDAQSTNIRHFSLVKDGTKSPPVLMLQTNKHIYYIKYGISSYYLLKYPSYIIAYLLLFLLFWLLQKVQNIYAQRKFETERQLMQQQLAISKNQLEPHFLLNTLNNIGYMFSQEDKKDAQYYFGKFSSLIYRSLVYADQVETSLEEELKFIKDYLILQKRRLGNDLNYLIEADEDINLNNITIPHSLIFTFVENAVKHGLRNKESDRTLKIFISRQKQKIIIIVSDNGIGRKQSKALNTIGTGKGLIIVTNIVEGYNKLFNRSISYEIVDLVDKNEKGVGTKVKVVT